MTVFRRTLLLALCLLLGVAPAAAKGFPVKPSDTDPRITKFNNPHFCWDPRGKARGELLLYLPGTGGSPRDHLQVATVAQHLGYHAVFLMYVDNVSAQTAAMRSSDPQAHMNFRKAILQGGTYGSMVIAPADSVENRLTKLLVYLSEHNPEQHWEQFLTSDKQPLWEKMVVAGGSQGGGHAYVLGKIHKVLRVLMFASPKDYNRRLHRPPAGFDDQTQTPINRFFAFNHERDNVGCTREDAARTFAQMKLTALGVANIDKLQPPYNHAHILYTNAEIGGGYHTSVIRAVFKDVWRYMLTEPTP